jgi:hypothetical protein
LTTANVIETSGNVYFTNTRTIQAITDSLTTPTGNSAISIGYRNIPQNIQSTNYVLALTDQGKHIYSTNTTLQSITIPTNANVGFPTGSAISIVLQGNGNILLLNSGVTLYLAGTSGARANANIASYGIATLLKVNTDTWFISGAGVS